jgi:hypothetical protein
MTAQPLDEFDLPEWIWEHELLTPDQIANCLPATQWMHLLAPSDLGPSDVLVALRLHTYVLGKKKGDPLKSWRSHQTIAADTHLAERTVWVSLNRLDAKGWIVRDKRHKPAHIYLAWPDPAGFGLSTAPQHPATTAGCATPHPATGSNIPQPTTEHPATDDQDPAVVADKGVEGTEGKTEEGGRQDFVGRQSCRVCGGSGIFEGDACVCVVREGTGS